MSPRAVVIGAGMGGLVAARLLQRRGFGVTVLERHTRPGGLLHRFFRDGLAYDTGFHYCGAVQAGSPLGQVLRHVGVFDQLTFRELDPDGFDRLRFPDLEVRVPRGWEAYRDRLVDLFPHERAGIDGVIRAMRDAVACYGLYRMQPDSDLAGLLAAESSPLLEALHTHVRDPRLVAVLCGQAVLYGVPPRDASLGVHALILDHFLGGAYTIAGGGDRLAMALTRAIRRDGGQVLLRHEACGIDTDGRHATAVDVVGGARFPADVVISNLHPRLTLGLLPDDATRPIQRRRVASTRVGHGHLGVYLEVEGPVPELAGHNLYRHRSWDIDAAYRSTGPDGPALYYASCPTGHHDPDAARSVVLQIAPLAWDDVAALGHAPPEAPSPAYLDHKRALLDGAVAALVADVPSLAGRIRRREASTPLTTWRFTRSPEGAMYGHLHSRDQMGRFRPSARTRLRNLVMVGQGVFSPGVLGTALSAYYGVGHLLGLPALLDELRRA